MFTDSVSPITGNVIKVEWCDIGEDSQRMIMCLGFKKPCSEFVTTHFEEDTWRQTLIAKIDFSTRFDFEMETQ